MQKNDDLWKGILDDFLRFIHPNADEICPSKFLDKELRKLFPLEKPHDRFSDLTGF